MLDWSSWEFWAKDIAPIAGGAAGLLLLAIRTRAVNRSAKAAVDQAETAAERHEQQTAADRERRITESFAKAIEQLGNDKLEVRLGGIYTLERIARESERDYWPIMETLTAYVRKRAPWPPLQAVANPFAELQGGIAAGDEAIGKRSASKPETEPKIAILPATDIQAVLTVLGRRDEAVRQRDQGRRLDLERTDL